MKVVENIRSIDLYTTYYKEKIVEAKTITDIGCGIYPCYYFKNSESLIVSSSVIEIIKHFGDFKLNKNFLPRDFYNLPSATIKAKRSSFFENISECKWYSKKFKIFIYILLKFIGLCIRFNINKYLFEDHYYKYPNWYVSNESIDKRIKKIKPFEKVSIINGSKNTFNPSYKISNKNEIVNKASTYITQFINKIENQFHDYHNVILTAGKDSQLIWLANKEKPSNWSCFSASPNSLIVKNWLESNKIIYHTFFEHDGQNDENLNDLKLKTIASDLYSDLANIRWLTTLKQIGEHFNNKCIFWGGTAWDAIFNYYPLFHESKKKFYNLHQNRVSKWQGNYHQTFKNFTKLPYLSPFHSEEIWNNLITKMNPLFIKKYGDIRNELGEVLAQRQILWINENPAPVPYNYNFEFNPYEYYLDYILNLVNEK